jgi:hypothetical protein
MNKALFVVALVLSLNGMAQEVAEATKPDNGVIALFPSKLQDNALVVLSVNFVLAVLAIVLRKIPGKVGSVIQTVIDLFSANVKHR